LPKYRGPSPINYAIANNDKETGVTLMYMDKTLDTGNIIIQESVSIDKEETFSSLYNKLSLIGSKLIKENINYLCSDNVSSIKQDDSLATYTKIFNHEDEKID
jgi:methionyl-tRNA formyltransferase